jgi:hypothetical protein
MLVCVHIDDTCPTHAVSMSGFRRWWRRYLELFVMEVRCPNGSTYVVAINATGFGECWLPIELRPGDPDEPDRVLTPA